MFLLTFSAVAALHASPRTSANYTITVDTADLGGGRAASATYTDDSSIGSPGGLSSVAAPAETARDGYAGQLFNITGLTLTAVSPNVNEGTADQLAAWQSLDDDTFLAVPATSVTWGVVSGPVVSLSQGGLATAGTVYQDTAATVQGTYLGDTGTLVLSVKNVSLDNFGAYAGDGIDDKWQVDYFGQPPNANAGPNADFDGTGQTNLFKYIAGLNPLDGSRFVLTIAPVDGQSGQKSLTFFPIVAGRTYTVKAKADLTGATWDPVAVSPPMDNGDHRTVTDPAATGAAKFYHIEITKP